MPAATASRRGVFRFLPSDAMLLPLGIFLLFALSPHGESLLNQADAASHLGFGQAMLSTGEIPGKDILSFAEERPWTAHSWFSQVVTGWLFLHTGLAGVVVFYSMVIMLTCWVMARLALAEATSNRWATFVVLALAIVASHVHWLARPHLLSLFLLAVWYRVLDLHYRGEGPVPWVLPGFMLLWVNLHGGWISGMVMLGTYGLSSFVEDLLAGKTFVQAAKSSRTTRLAVLFALSAAAACVNPYGPKVFLFPLQVVSDNFFMNYIREYATPDFHSNAFLPFMLLLLSSVAILAFSTRRPSVAEVLLLISNMYSALYSQRSIPIYAIIAAPILARHASSICFSRNPVLEVTQVPLPKKRKDLAFALGALVVVSIWATAASSSYSFPPGFEPVGAIRFASGKEMPKRLFCDDGVGGFLHMRHPLRYQPFMDPRVDSHGVAKIKEYLKAVKAQPGWREVLDRHGMDWAIFRANTALHAALSSPGSGFRQVFSDNVASVFVREGSAAEAAAEE